MSKEWKIFFNIFYFCKNFLFKIMFLLQRMRITFLCVIPLFYHCSYVNFVKLTKLENTYQISNIWKKWSFNQISIFLPYENIFYTLPFNLQTGWKTFFENLFPRKFNSFSLIFVIVGHIQCFWEQLQNIKIFECVMLARKIAIICINII